ncbi:putative membrane protein [Rhodopirellula maiorica SM1]|uniref:Putative membrane protein n=1 Tax=Rhodopirellula maiorica SM1 TaxID=1265738 RepID=M5RFF3_9BACT|nr:putative membrane protein [Rhodopirellula maiorica SM1]
MICPRCSKSVSIPDSSAGLRVSCPHCAAAFLAPGLSATTSDDADDWLTLDTDPVPANPPSAPTTEKPKPRRSTSPDEDTLLGEFAAELDEFTSTVESVPQPKSAGIEDGDDPFVLRPALSRPPVGAPRPAPVVPTPVNPAPASSGGDDDVIELGDENIVGDEMDLAAELGAKKPAVEYATEYRVQCLTCGSQRMVHASQAGKTIKCNDCHSPIRVRQPPRLPKKVEIDIDNAATFAFEATQVSSSDRRSDPYRKSAQQLLDEASRVEETVYKHDDDIPSISGWLASIFGIFRDVGVLAHWVALSLIASVPAIVVLASEVRVLQIALVPAGIVFGLVVVSCGFAILQSIANGEEKVSEWPVFDPAGWIENLVEVFSAAGFAIIPVYGLAQFVFGQSLLTAALTMLSLYIFFPFVLLSMLDSNSPLTPFSAEVARSVTRAQEAWGGLYFTAAIMFFALFLTYAVSSTLPSPVAAVGGIFLTVGMAFVYFAMIGRLAYAIGQEISEPPAAKTSDEAK